MQIHEIQQGKQVPPRGGEPGASILIVDDNKDFAENIAEVVEDLGFKAEVAHSGHEALHKIRSSNFNAAVVDIQLPDISGTRVIAHVKEHCPDCVCIVFTGNATLRNAVDALNHGAFAYLAKGGEVDEFRAALRNALESNRNILELRRIREINSAILENFPGLMLILDDRGTVLLCNDPRSLGAGGGPPGGGPSAVAGKALAEALQLDRGLAEHVLRGYAGMRGKTQAEVLSRIPGTGGPDGELELFDVRFVPLGETAAHMLIVIENVTQAARMEREIDKKNRLAAVGELAATIAHEVRNPLSGISGAIQILKRRLPAQDMGREICDQVIGQVDRLNNTIEDLLVLSRPMTPRFLQISLSDFIESSVGFLRDDPNFKTIDVVYQAEEGDWTARADAFLLRQAFMNLLINAGQAMGGKGRITITLVREGTDFQLVIHDSGPGFPPNPARLFEPFYTTKPGGSGLGLPITAKILEVHGGRVLLHNHERGGAVVTLILPQPAGA